MDVDAIHSDMAELKNKAELSLTFDAEERAKVLRLIEYTESLEIAAAPKSRPAKKTTKK